MMHVRIVFPILPSSVAVEMLDLKIDVHKTIFRRAGFEITAENKNTRVEIYLTEEELLQLIKQVKKTWKR